MRVGKLKIWLTDMHNYFYLPFDCFAAAITKTHFNKIRGVRFGTKPAFIDPIRNNRKTLTVRKFAHVNKVRNEKNLGIIEDDCNFICIIDLDIDK